MLVHRHDEMRARRDEIYAVARARKAEKLWVFGSRSASRSVDGGFVFV